LPTKPLEPGWSPLNPRNPEMNSKTKPRRAMQSADRTSAAGMLIDVSTFGPTLSYTSFMPEASVG
jgi:hypothetical protein